MSWIDNITKENFDQSFNIKSIIIDSTFYPASGIDATNIEALSCFTKSFIHVDYSVPKTVVLKALTEDFIPVGYEVIGLKVIEHEDLIPFQFIPGKIPRLKSESKRITFLNNSKKNLVPFSVWAVYSLNENSTYKKANKIKRFSILHIGGEACDAFKFLYVHYKTNPTAIAILNPGEGYGDNWTKFTDTESPFYKLLEVNSKKNKIDFPQILFTNNSDPANCFWPNYTCKNVKLQKKRYGDYCIFLKD